MKTLMATILMAVLGLSWTMAGEPEKKSERTKKKQEPQEVITNETLKKKYGPPEPAPAPEKAEAGQAAPKEARPVQAPAKPDPTLRVAALKKEEDRLQRRIRSLKNPFLPRVPLTEEEKKAEEGKKADERVRMLEKRLLEIRAELKAAEAEAAPGRSP